MDSKCVKRSIVGLGLALAALFFGAQAALAQSATCDVTWRKADGPRVISDTVTIPANQTLCIEPGVIVQLNDGGRLHVYGRMQAIGTSAERLTFRVSGSQPGGIEIVGTADVQFADVTATFNLNPGGSIVCRDCSFGARGGILSGGLIFNYQHAFVLVENSVFDSNAQFNNASFYLGNVSAILRNVTFRNAAFFAIDHSYLYTDNVVSQNRASDGLSILQDYWQPQFLDNLNITNCNGGGLILLAGNYELGPNVTIQNCVYPVKINHSGLLPASNIPATGNQNNWIDGSLGGDGIYGRFAIPYVSGSADFSRTDVMPGVVIKARPNFAFTTETGPGRVLGLPTAPITIEPFTPGQKWDYGEFRSAGDRMEYVVLDGSRKGIIKTGIGGVSYYIDNSVFRNHDTALTSPTNYFAYLQGNLFTNNGIALKATTGGIRAAGDTNPNLFENNALAVSADVNAIPDARFNWWNSPTGPTTPQNPGGTGDRIDGTTYFQPFRATRPDTSDHPPVVRLPRRPYRQTAGNHEGLIENNQKIILQWTAFDDRAIVKQKILFSANENLEENFNVIADNLPPGQRSYEFTMPNVGASGGSHKVIRVVAVDEKGQEGWDEWQPLVPRGTEPGALQITTPVAGQTFRGGSVLELDWTVTAPFNTSQFEVFLLLDADRKADYVSAGNASGAFTPIKMPYISTDSARFAVSSLNGGNDRKWFFTEPFAIRPDARWPDAPPTISMSSPAAGEAFQPGALIPISWTAGDDEALRSFSILYSTDGGRTWLTLVENLPPTTTSYNWQTPPGTGFNDVRVRVVAIDRRFQNSSDGANRPFRTNANSPANSPPLVQLTYPANGATFLIGQSAFIAAEASDPDGAIARIEFYDGATFIALDANAPYQVGLNYLSGGTHTLTARAVDNLGATTVSAPVSITVNARPGPAPLPINPPSLSSPTNGARYTAPANITVSAVTNGAAVARVEFYNGTQLIGSDTTAPYEVTWNNVAAGTYTIFAKTIATSGAEAISQPADITVGSATAPRRAMFDFDGDGKSDISVWQGDSGKWHIIQSGDAAVRLQYWGERGLGDIAVPGDYDGDGKTDIAIFRPSEGNWHIIKSSDGLSAVQGWGQSGDRPVPADYDGDGKTDVAVYRPSDGNWYVRKTTGGVMVQGWGDPTDKLLPGDYDGDGRADFAVYRPADGNWYIVQSTGGVRQQNWGLSEDRPVPGDYDGDGKMDIAVWRPSEGNWYIVLSSGGATIRSWGEAADWPVPGDYDGDGKTDIAVWRPGQGTWYVISSGANSGAQHYLGSAVDIPIPSTYLPY